MPIFCKDIAEYLESIAPKNKAEDWDNVGLLIGDYNQKINKILVCLDITNDVIEEAINEKVELIISHHPIIFKSLKSINSETVLGNKLLKCIKNNISIYSFHTNFDVAKYGLNDILFDLLELTNKENFMDEDVEGFSLGRVGQTKQSISLSNFCDKIKQILNLKMLHFTGNENKIINKVAFCTGSASGMKYFLKCLEKKCDVYITSDIGHHDAIDALELGLQIIDATHYATEFIFIKYISELLQNKFSTNSNLKIIQSKSNKPIFNVK